MPYKIIKLESKEDCINHTKHCGWCTSKEGNDHYQNLYSHGDLYAIYKPQKKRTPNL